MSKRQGGRERDEYGDHTYGHNLLTSEMVTKLASFATHWAVIIHFENDDMVPNHALFPAAGLINIFEQGKLCRASLLAGFKTTRQPQRPVPPCFFRTLDFLLQYISAGNNYRAITDKEEVKGFPPAGWCRPPVVAAPDDAAAATEALVCGASPAALERAPATDPIRLFYASRSWCVIYSFHVSASTVRVDVGKDPAEMYRLYCEGALSGYSAVVGLQEDAPPSNLWVPPCVMMPLGALIYMHGHGRPYLPISLTELRAVRNGGIAAVGERKTARPLQLPPGVWPVEHHGGERYGDGGGAGGAEAAAGTTSSSGAGRGTAASSGTVSAAASRLNSRVGSSAAIAGSSAGGGGASAAGSGAGGGGAGMARSGGGGGGSGLGTAGAASSSGGGGSGAVDGRASKPDPEPELDPFLNSSNWIMPKPFDTPIPPPPVLPEPDGAAAPSDAGAAVPPAEADGDAAAAAAVPDLALALPPSPFFASHNNGVQPAFETPPLRLFFGDRAQLAMTANWWFIDPATHEVRGPHSPEQMVLSYVTGCAELHDETRVCGTEADVRLPMVPPRAAFLPIAHLASEVNEGATYALVSRVDIISPLQQRFLSHRIRPPRPATATAASASPSPTPTPVVLAVQQPVPTVAAVAPPLQTATSQPQVLQAQPSLTPVVAAAQPAPVTLVQRALSQSPPPPPLLQAQPPPPPQPQQHPLVPHAALQPPPPPQPPHLLHHMFRPPLLPTHPLALPGQVRPPVPAFVMPGGMMYVQQLGPGVGGGPVGGMPFPGQQMMVQSVLPGLQGYMPAAPPPPPR